VAIITTFLSVTFLIVLIIFIIIGAVIWYFGYKEFKKRSGTRNEMILFWILVSIVLTVIANASNALNDGFELSTNAKNGPEGELLSPNFGDNVSGTIDIIFQVTDVDGDLESCELWLSTDPDGYPIEGFHWKQNENPCKKIILRETLDTTKLDNGRYYFNGRADDSWKDSHYLFTGLIKIYN
jgi:hypothetical protein